MSATLDDGWVSGCEVDFDDPVGINFQSDPAPGTGIVSSALVATSEPSMTQSVDEWFFNTAYEAGTYWFQGFCTGPEGGRYTDAVPFTVTESQIPVALKLDLHPASGGAVSEVRVTVEPPFPSGAVPCDSARQASVVVSTSSDRRDIGRVVHRTAVEAPAGPVSSTRTLQAWLDRAPTELRYWFWAECPYINDTARTGYSPSVAFDTVLAPAPIAAPEVRAMPVEAVPAFTG
ncbi:hypothetical protein [Rhabdothermincola salaria]|uniref:hypothetical protein n=1 Tax=Rhabdothermincola salaria TaxID=2903142 RepID=UPI001E2CDE54|nr:hypothetical protein [Rhabdothermincola salaria]MCD9625237.1 hypothetical protein [Rhabdothermincola salaria]